MVDLFALRNDEIGLVAHKQKRCDIYARGLMQSGYKCPA